MQVRQTNALRKHTRPEVHIEGPAGVREVVDAQQVGRSHHFAVQTLRPSVPTQKQEKPRMEAPDNSITRSWDLGKQKPSVQIFFSFHQFQTTKYIRSDKLNCHKFHTAIYKIVQKCFSFDAGCWRAHFLSRYCN